MNSVPKRISILLVPRCRFYKIAPKLEDYYHKGVDLYDSVDRLLCAKSRNVFFEGNIPKEDLQILSFQFPNTKTMVEEKVVKEKETPVKVPFFQRLRTMDAYGVISTFIVVGSLFITLGIILSIVFLLRG